MANEKYTMAAPGSFCKIDKIAGVKAMAAAISCDRDLAKLVSGSERYFANASEVNILHNSTG